MKFAIGLVVGLVLSHHGVAYHHGNQHAILAIDMAVWQNAFINGVILVLPILGAILLFTRWRILGAYGVLIGMLGALVFGIAHHYMLISPDHISHLPGAEPHVHQSFVWTAGAIAILEGLAAMSAAYLIGRSNNAEHDRDLGKH